MIIPFAPFLFKEIAIKASLAYNDSDFKETVDCFVAGSCGGIVGVELC
jgi:hypothetical protein